MKLDIEAIAREAELKMCRALSFPDSAVGTMNRNSPLFTQAFAALLLEKAAQVCDGIDQAASSNAPALCAMRIREMAAGMGE